MAEVNGTMTEVRTVVGYLAPENSVQVTRGANKTLMLTVQKDDGSYFDLTGSSLIFSVKKRVEDDRPLITKKSSVESEILIEKPREGKAKIFILPNDTVDLALAEYVYDVWLITSEDPVRRLVVVPTCTFEVVAGVTRFR